MVGEAQPSYSSVRERRGARGAPGQAVPAPEREGQGTGLCSRGFRSERGTCLQLRGPATNSSSPKYTWPLWGSFCCPRTGNTGTEKGRTWPQHHNRNISSRCQDLELFAWRGRMWGGGRGGEDSHENRLDGVFDVAKGSPAQQFPKAPLSQLCRVLLFFLWRLEGRGGPAVGTHSVVGEGWEAKLGARLCVCCIHANGDSRTSRKFM